jgi:hypothetical protein
MRAAGVEGTPLLLFLEEPHLADDPGEQSDLSFTDHIATTCHLLAARSQMKC